MQRGDTGWVRLHDLIASAVEPLCQSADPRIRIEAIQLLALAAKLDHAQLAQVAQADAAEEAAISRFRHPRLN